ncbi:putative quinol monooxygenase [Pseudoxanthomonas putridarboris]|uniref:Quinol monooxygenase n=1 Tax=Pseudoxanthomonas putridarboris TaxID=752605 RepID=A0ABU9IZR7_9GAMM
MLIAKAVASCPGTNIDFGRLGLRYVGSPYAKRGTSMRLDDWFEGAKIVGPQAKIAVTLTARPAQEQALESLLRGMVEPCRSEPGNLRWDLWKDPAHPGRFVIDELYRDVSAVAEHRETPHFKHYFSVIDSMAERQSYVVVPFIVADVLSANAAVV